MVAEPTAPPPSPAKNRIKKELINSRILIYKIYQSDCQYNCQWWGWMVAHIPPKILQTPSIGARMKGVKCLEILVKNIF